MMTDTIETDGELLSRMGTDATKWAKEFAVMCLAYGESKGGFDTPDEVEEFTLGWFANAIEAGRIAGLETAKLDMIKVQQTAEINFGMWLTTRPNVMKVGGSETVYAMNEALMLYQQLNASMPLPTEPTGTFASLQNDWLTKGVSIRRKSWPAGDYIDADGAEGGTIWYYTAQFDDLELDYGLTFNDICAADWEIAPKRPYR